jgi:hypothetical protein
MSEEIDALVRRLERAKAKRLPWESTYQECYDYAVPGRTSFFQRATGQVAPDVFDETAVVATPEFASRIQAGLMPNYARWAELAAGSDVDPAQAGEVNKALEQVTDYVFEVLQNSNLAQEANECLIDTAVGTACLEVHEGDAINPVVFTAVPLPELHIDTGPDDKIDTYFRTRQVRLSQIEYAYPGAVVPPEVKRELGKDTDKDDPLVEVVLCIYRDWSKPAETNELRIFLPKHKKIIRSATLSGAGSNPYIGWRWSKVAGEAWGRGPLFNCLAAVRTANLVVQLTLENAEMAIAGVYTAEDDGVVSVDNIRLVPGTIIPVAPGSAGLQQVGGAGDFNVGQLILGDMRNNIKKALFNETLGSPDTTPMSATEVAQRMADLSRQIGSAFGRLQVEFVNRVLQRVIFILKKRGLIQLPTVNGREVKIVATSPLSQAQAVEDINAVDSWLGLMGRHFGPQMVNLYSDGAQVAEYCAKKFGVPERLRRDEKGRAQLAQQIATIQQGGESLGPEIPGTAPSIGA